MITALLLAIKYHEDHYYDNVYYAKVGGVTCRELNLLEIEMLNLLEYDLYVSQELYEHCLEGVNSYEIKGVSFLSPGTNGKVVGEGGFSAACCFSKVSSQASIKTVPSSSDLIVETVDH